MCMSVLAWNILFIKNYAFTDIVFRRKIKV
jgi:hypothetical protein